MFATGAFRVIIPSNPDMLTNIVATVTVSLVTNTTEIFPQHMVSDPAPTGPNGEVLAVYYGHWANVDNPNEKWVKTEVVERHVYDFSIESNPREVFVDNPITNWTVHFDKRDDWVVSTTNPPPPQNHFP